MSKLSELKPNKKERVCDLLERAGVKVERNRFFLSKCAFDKDEKIVLNFWYGKQIKQQGENIIVKWPLPTTTKEASPRMRTVHNAIKSAIEKNLKIRIIVLDGKMAKKGSKVYKRSLDPMAWSVKTYNEKTGKCVLMRDIHPDNGSRIKKESAIDDLSDVPEGNDFPDRAKVIAHIIKRDNRVRAHALKRAKGRCEYCRVQGFRPTNGGFYVEAHHIIALCDSGRDTVDNVIALCPQHHRQAHYGANAESMESEFIRILKKLNRKK
jgi:5-methylcytosine-specific restriction enzyme A